MSSRNRGLQLRDLNKHRVNVAGKKNYLRQSLYDFQPYVAAGQNQLLFFQVPKGQGGKTIADTNMEGAGALPNPKMFIVESIEILFFPGDLPVTSDAAAAIASAPAVPNFTNDVYTVQKSGSVKFFIGSTSYVEEAPIGRFPSKTRLNTDGGSIAIGGGVGGAGDFLASNTNDYASFSGRPYKIDPEIVLEPTQNFVVELNWPALVPLPSGTAGRIGVVLDGILIRNAQ